MDEASSSASAAAAAAGSADQQQRDRQLQQHQQHAVFDNSEAQQLLTVAANRVWEELYVCKKPVGRQQQLLTHILLACLLTYLWSCFFTLVTDELDGMPETKMCLASTRFLSPTLAGLVLSHFWQIQSNAAFEMALLLFYCGA